MEDNTRAFLDDPEVATMLDKESRSNNVKELVIQIKDTIYHAGKNVKDIGNFSMVGQEVDDDND